jgi:hypothetical protein
VDISTCINLKVVQGGRKKLSEVECKEQYYVEISNRFAALENLDDEVDIKISTKESLGYYELKKHKPWFNKGCSKLLDQRKQAKLNWLQDPNKINGANLNNIGCGVSRHFRNKKREYKNKNKLRGISPQVNLYRPSDRCLSAKLVPTLVDRGCHVVSTTNPPQSLFSVF